MKQIDYVLFTLCLVVFSYTMIKFQSLIFDVLKFEHLHVLSDMDDKISLGYSYLCQFFIHCVKLMLRRTCVNHDKISLKNSTWYKKN